MSWIVTGLTVGSAIFGGFGAQTSGERKEQIRLAGEVKQERMALLGEEKGLAFGAAQSQYAGGVGDVGSGFQAGQRDISYTTGKTGLATSGAIQTQTGDLLAKYKSDMTKLFETRDLSRTQAELSYRKGEMSAEEAYQNTLTGIESQPTGFIEGMFS